MESRRTRARTIKGVCLKEQLREKISISMERSAAVPMDVTASELSTTLPISGEFKSQEAKNTPRGEIAPGLWLLNHLCLLQNSSTSPTRTEPVIFPPPSVSPARRAVHSQPTGSSGCCREIAWLI